MIELMFAAALSGMPAGEAAASDQLVAIDYRLAPSTADESPQNDWRKLVGADSSFDDERDCPVFFQKEIPGFGSMRLNSACTQTKEDELWP
jgi:hypothetical protein